MKSFVAQKIYKLLLSNRRRLPPGQRTLVPKVVDIQNITNQYVYLRSSTGDPHILLEFPSPVGCLRFICDVISEDPAEVIRVNYRGAGEDFCASRAEIVGRADGVMFVQDFDFPAPVTHLCLHFTGRDLLFQLRHLEFIQMSRVAMGCQSLQRKVLETTARMCERLIAWAAIFVDVMRCGLGRTARRPRETLRAEDEFHEEELLRENHDEGVSDSYTYVADLDVALIRDQVASFRHHPLISIVMPVYNVDPGWLDLTIASVEAQLYTEWELCIVDGGSSYNLTKDYLRTIHNPKVMIRFLRKDLGICEATNAAIGLAQGEYIAFLHVSDELTNNALYEVVQVINHSDPDLIYSDEDFIGIRGRFTTAFFKPDWSPDMFLSYNYVKHLSVIRSNLIKAVGSVRSEYAGSEDYDLLLRCLDEPRMVSHIPKVLYHGRRILGSTVQGVPNRKDPWENGRKALQAALERRSLAGTAILGPYRGTYRVKYDVLGMPKVSIIIPFRDKPELLRICINSVLTKSTYSNFEIIGINNASQLQETIDLMRHLETLDDRIAFYNYDAPFNYSKINNYGASLATGEHLLLLNSDTEVITPEWIETLLEHSQRGDVGIVGAKLYYANDTIQHAGIVMGLPGVAGHVFRHFDKDEVGYFYRTHVVHNVSAVTAACVMVKKSTFNEVEGFDENLAIAFNDIDLCLRVDEMGKRNVFTPFCELYHHEAQTRGAPESDAEKAREWREAQYCIGKHQELIDRCDPYYNPNLTRDKEDFGFRSLPVTGHEGRHLAA